MWEKKNQKVNLWKNEEKEKKEIVTKFKNSKRKKTRTVTNWDSDKNHIVAKLNLLQNSNSVKTQTLLKTQMVSKLKFCQIFWWEQVNNTVIWTQRSLLQIFVIIKNLIKVKTSWIFFIKTYIWNSSNQNSMHHHFRIQEGSPEREGRYSRRRSRTICLSLR